MRILAAHLKPGDMVTGVGGDPEGEEVLEVRQDAESVTILTLPGRMVTIGAARTVDIADRRDVLLG